MSKETARVFNYHQDITLTVGGNTYKVQALLDMEDTDFDAIYQEYQLEMGQQMDAIQGNPGAQLGMIGALSVIDMMERIRLERRLIVLENK